MTRLQPVCQPDCSPPDMTRRLAALLLEHSSRQVGTICLSFLTQELFFLACAIIETDSYTSHSRCNGICIDGYSPTGYIAFDLAGRL